jgi:two-component system chemotaxis sensor kinase CheA
MVPIGPRFEQHRRAVRDLSRAAGKPVQLVIEGRDVQIDASLVEQIKDPLTHMIRNAVDHGLETTAVRKARGKSETATITLRAFHDGGSVVLQVSDDGGGFDREGILKRARERGMAPSGATPSDEEIFGYVFAPGFSTSEQVTEISGRGVGMDVVSRAVAAMRGSLHVTSTPGVGATISLRLPLTLAMLEGLVVVAGDERFVVPMDAITECVALPPTEPRERTFGIADVRGRTVPYVRLRRFLGLEGGAHAPVEQMVIVEAEHIPVGIVADDLLGQAAVVIKPLGKILRSVPGVSASTIFPDGRVGVILDVAAIVRRSQREPARV